MSDGLPPTSPLLDHDYGPTDNYSGAVRREAASMSTRSGSESHLSIRINALEEEEEAQDEEERRVLEEEEDEEGLGAELAVTTLSRQSSLEDAPDWAQRLQALVDMGFELEQAQVAIINTVTLEDALQLLFARQEPDHRFARDYEWGVDSCTICGRARAEHPLNADDSSDDEDERLPQWRLDLQRELSAASAGGVDIERFEPEVHVPVEVPDRYDRIEGDVMCIVCMDSLDEERCFEALPCGHADVCTNCLSRYCSGLIKDARVTPDQLQCPHPDCPVPIPEEQVLKHVDDAVEEKYHRFIFKAEVNRDPNARFCSTLRCEGVVRRRDESTRKAVCDECGEVTCFTCHEPYHRFRSCEAVIESSLASYAAANGLTIVKCPRCTIAINKAVGCHHVTCSNCRYEFCWLCGGAYDDDHFAPYNLAGCPGMQSGSCHCNFLGRLFVRLGLIILIIISIPFLIVIGVLYPLLYLCEKHDTCVIFPNALFTIARAALYINPCTHCLVDD